MDGPRCVKTGALSHSVILQKTGAFWASRGAGAAAAPVDAGFPNTAFLPEMLSFWPRSWSARSEPESAQSHEFVPSVLRRLIGETIPEQNRFHRPSFEANSTERERISKPRGKGFLMALDTQDYCPGAAQKDDWWRNTLRCHLSLAYPLHNNWCWDFSAQPGKCRRHRANILRSGWCRSISLFRSHRTETAWSRK